MGLVGLQQILPDVFRRTSIKKVNNNRLTPTELNTLKIWIENKEKLKENEKNLYKNVRFI